MLIEVEKFPRIEFRGAPLVWDSRQPSQAGEWVIITLDAHEKREIRERLLARPGARFIGPAGSGFELEVADPRRFLGLASAAHFNSPAARLRVFGVTGTNGKTTCSTLLRAQLAAGGHRVAEIGTLGLRVFEGADQRLLLEAETGFTTADSPTLHSLLAQFVSNGVDCVVMECSSHGSTLARVAGVDFDGMLFTNLTQDHLDFHKTMEAYEEAKTELFTRYLGFELGPLEAELFPQLRSMKKPKAAINADDPAGCRILQRLPPEVEGLPYRRVGAGAALRGGGYRVAVSDPRGLELEHADGARIRSPLIGAFNAENLAGSYGLLRAFDLASPVALETFNGATGRMQNVADPGQPAVFVDYAHTPDALEKALGTLRDVLPAGARLCVAFGCGGDRDAGKRPQMGLIAARLADEVVLCSDNPRTEDPLAILRQIEAGIPAPLAGKVRIEENRARAIESAIDALDAARNDVLLIAGKGHEEYQIVGERKLPFSDAAAARAALAKRTLR